jgi:hypothetical protein
VYDQIGNAWEWADPEESGDDGVPPTAKLGGAWYTGPGSGSCLAPPVTLHPPAFDGTIAARCGVAAEQEPERRPPVAMPEELPRGAPGGAAAG